MKKSVFITAVLACLFLAGQAQGITGKWEGPLSVGSATLKFVINISATATEYKASFDSPDQQAFGIPGAQTTVEKDSITVTIPAMHAVFRGRWNQKDDLIEALLIQGPAQMPLALKRQAVALRPQTPKPPFAYQSEDVEYDNADKTVHYGATFTKPANKTDFPTVIIISGSGSQDRDGTLFGHKVYGVLADYLTSHGIGVLRVDDRGVGKSTIGNNPATLTSAVFEKDVEASLDYLLSRTDLNKKRIGLIGHSEGGIIAPMVAARRKEVAFIVLWGAPVVGGLKINTEQNAYSLQKAGIDSTAIAAFKKLHTTELALFANTTREELDEKVKTVYADWKKSQAPQILTALTATETSIVGQNITTMYHSLYDLAWMRFFISYDPTVDLAKVKCPVLAIIGEKDTQVSAADNLPLIASVLAKNGNKNVTTQMLPSLNHLFQTAVTGDTSEYEKIEETMSPTALAIIAAFIGKQ